MRPSHLYLPLARLADVLAYPLEADRFGTATMRHALELAALDALADRLPDTEAWSRRLSPGEQQRLQFARLFLHRPTWILLDEATSALDTATQSLLLGRLRRMLPDAALLHGGHREELMPFHDRVLRIAGGRVLAMPVDAPRQSA